MNIFSYLPKFHATHFSILLCYCVLLCVTIKVSTIFCLSTLTHTHEHSIIGIWFYLYFSWQTECWMEKEEERWKHRLEKPLTVHLYHEQEEEEQKVSVAKIHISLGNGYHIDDHTHAHGAHTHSQWERYEIVRAFIQMVVCSNTQRWTTEISVLFDICNDKIQPNERATLLACWLARSFTHSLSMKSFDSGRPHIHNEQFYLFAILLIHVKQFIRRHILYCGFSFRSSDNAFQLFPRVTSNFFSLHQISLSLSLQRVYVSV